MRPHHSSHSGNHEGVRNSVPGTRDGRPNRSVIPQQDIKGACKVVAFIIPSGALPEVSNEALGDRPAKS